MTGDAWLDRTPFPSPLLRGLARNPAAPVEVLLQLLASWPEQACAGLRRRRELPPPVLEAMCRHSSPRIRGALAAHPTVDAETRAHLLSDPEWRVRVRAFGAPGQEPLSRDVLAGLLTTLDGPPADMPFSQEELLAELFWRTGHDRRLLQIAATHPRPGVRRFAAGSLLQLEPERRQALLDDEAPEVRAAAEAVVAYERQVMEPADLPSGHGHALWSVLQRPLSTALIDQVLAGGDAVAQGVMGTNRTLPRYAVQRLLHHPDPSVRLSVAGRDDLTPGDLVILAADSDIAVRTAVSVHPGLTEDQRAGIAIDVTIASGDGNFGRTAWRGVPVDNGPTLTDALRWARSVNPLLRRRAARSSELPADVVGALADDPDLGVRVLLAQHHPDAPPALLLRSYLEYHGIGRDRLCELPQFPTQDLARFAGHADPAVRRLVALDPQAEPALIDHLTTDSDVGVRQAMAGCPRISAARLTVLLRGPELGEDAAANPNLPADHMRDIVAGRTPGADPT